MALEQFARYKVPKFQSSLEVFGRFEEIDPITDDPRCQVYLPDKINDELLAKMGAPTSSSSFGAVSLEDKFSALPMPNRSEGGEEASSECRVKFLHGTTTLAFKYRNGVVVATDSRASAGGYIASSTVKKIIEIDARLVGTMAGGAADCLFWERNLARYCRLYALRNRAPISVAAASKFLSNMLYQYRGMGLSVGTMISGYDKTGPGLFYVDDDGVRFTGTLFSVGSGSPYAYGVLDQGWRWDLSDDEAFELAQRSIYHATFRDAGSGGFVRIYHIGPNGWRPISLKDVQIIHEERERDEKLELAAVPAARA